MTEVLMDRARGIAQQFPFPRAPREQDITLFIAGHGTGQNEDSRKSAERQVELLRAAGAYSAVHAIFMEEEPQIERCYELAKTTNIVVVPFFISDGLHVQEDIPVLLGESASVVKQRLANRQPAWRNPTEKRDHRVWYTPCAGSDPVLTEVILARVRESAQPGWD
jgi:sirohydrochlorin cobaltochelatase